MFSVIVPVYNKADYVFESINSVLSQTYSDFEVIVVNDGSTDHSIDIVRQISDDRLVIIEKNNGGVSSARNDGIKKSKGEYVCFLDADDILYPDALSTYSSLIEKYPDYKVFVAATDVSIKKYPSSGKTYIVDDYLYYNARNYAMNGFSLVNTDCICIERSFFEVAGYFNENYSHGEDQDLWWRLAHYTNFIKIEKAIGMYRTNITNNSSHVDKSLRKCAPFGTIARNRKEVQSKSQKYEQGRLIFYEILNNFWKNPLAMVALAVKYPDCVARFVFLLIKFRLI